MFERRLYHHIDWALLIAILALCTLGVVMIYSTTSDPTRGASRLFIKFQLFRCHFSSLSLSRASF